MYKDMFVIKSETKCTKPNAGIKLNKTGSFDNNPIQVFYIYHLLA